MNIGAGYTGPDDYATPVIETIPSYTFNVEIEVEGTGNPDDLYIDISPRLATYPEGTEVTLTAVNFAACCHDFMQWEGKGKTTNGQNIEGCDLSTITVIMTADTKVTAVYKNCSKGGTSGTTIYYDRVQSWFSTGYTGDRFHFFLSESKPFDYSEYFTFREHICVRSVDRRLVEGGAWSPGNAATIASSSGIDGTTFKITPGTKKVWDSGGGSKIEKTGYWLVGADGGDSDEHRLSAAGHANIEAFFRALPAAAKDEEYFVHVWQDIYSEGIPDDILCSAPITHKLHKIMTPGTCYEPADNEGFHDRVMKGGASHPCAWEDTKSVSDGFDMSDRYNCSACNCHVFN